ncbi:hydroxyacylglutathione hydrolase [Vibrio sp. ZSDE26]|uniref:Hydroxyacylglutathione hydrolase n=1 Tax=Vibrio amylolyticus TaxID=2847292 RepID=A0A9X2BG74_9VIBR|nr:hydroxyacylglutathione hydrolase [Vibrio amylolyticus]MCK6262611.1 hydroxyacylglutathione hydrolase [Vibrio amylolyticus]
MLHIKSIPAFNDNYIWLIENSDGRCVVVDPGDAKPVLEYLSKHDLTLNAILITHHHHDHIGGVPELVHQFPNIDVVGPEAEPIPTLTHPVSDGSQLELFGEVFTVIGIEGHTLGHIGYYGNGHLFCGDTLFSAGCGRVFEGTYSQMFDALTTLASLPDETKVYCAHEYTSSNVSFALAIEPESEPLRQYRDDVNRMRAQDLPTLPTTIKQEKRINPFLRCEEPNVIKSVTNRTQNLDPLSVFTALREWKNEF